MRINHRISAWLPARKSNSESGRPVVKPFFPSKERYQEVLGEYVRELSSLQRIHFASHRYALLLIIPGDGRCRKGRDHTAHHVGVDPQGCEVSRFQQPTAEELGHDFLWRTTCRLPERGRIGIFNRSYYEEVLVVRVHPEILRGQDSRMSCSTRRQSGRTGTRSIVDLEEHLYRNGTRIVKVFSPSVVEDEQRKRFLARINEPDKNWKFSQSDINERKYWKQYMKAYEAV